MRTKNEGPQRTTLIMSRESFVKELKKSIDEGRQILEMIPKAIGQVPCSYYGYGRKSSLVYDEGQKKRFIESCKQWIGYNVEFLKQAFDNPNSEYKGHFEGAGTRSFFTSDEDSVQLEREEIEDKISNLEGLIKKAPLIPVKVNETKSIEEAVKSKTIEEPDKIKNSKRVFIVHGHDSHLRDATELLIKSLDYEPVVLFKEPNGGKTIIEKLEREVKDVAFAIILYTPCDEGRAVGESELLPRARQNVVFEHGLMCGMLGRGRVVALKSGDVEIPTDLLGIVYISYDEGGVWKYYIAKEMKAAGLNIDLNKIR